MGRTLTHAWKEPFLEALRRSGNVRLAVESVSVAKATVYRAREADAEFAEAWDDALDDAADLLEQEARRRAVDGTERRKFVRSGTSDDGTPQYTELLERDYSDTLLIFLLKGARPEKYRESYDIKGLASAVAEAPSAGAVAGDSTATT